MDIDECIEEAKKDGDLPEDAVLASDVDAVDEDRDTSTIDRQRAKRAVEKRMARREAVKKAGGDVGSQVGSPDLHDSIEQGLKKRTESVTTAFRAREAAKRAVDAQRRRK